MSEQDKNQSIFQRLNNAIKNNWGKDKDTLGGTNGLKSYQLTDDDKKILFLRSWNEWGEGNYVEPDSLYGHGFLDAIKNEIKAE